MCDDSDWNHSSLGLYMLRSSLFSIRFELDLGAMRQFEQDPGTRFRPRWAPSNITTHQFSNKAVSDTPDCFYNVIEQDACL